MDNSNSISSEYYTPKEVATVLNLSTDLVYDLLRDGRLPAIRLGTGKRMVWRIPKEEFNKHLGSMLTKPKAANRE